MAADEVLTPAQLGLTTLSRLVETAQDGIAVLEPDGPRYRYVNPAGCRILDRSLDELAGRSAAVFAGAGGTGTAAGETSTVGYGGRELEFVVTPVLQDTALHVVRFRDVTDLRRQERRLTAFSRTSASIAFAGPLTAVLDRLAAEVRHATGVLACTFLLMDATGDLRQSGTSGSSYPNVDDYAERLNQCRQLGAPLLAVEAFETRRPVVAPGWRERTLRDARFAPLHEFSAQADWHTIAVVPLIVRDQVAGVFNVYYPEGHGPAEADLAFLTTIADLAAVAVDNARMLAELESKAALEERHRLARDLHDSVSQALFSVTLQTRAAELSLRQDPLDPELVARNLTEVGELTRGALAEMRALIFQLRPDALHEEGLVSAVRKHAAAVEAKSALQVTVDGTEADLALPENVEAQLFRVVQEALHNVVKHAGARHAVVRIAVAGPEHRDLVVEITDDGCGFDTAGEYRGHLGLRSMAERVAGLGGTFGVTSRPAGPTTVRAVLAGAVAPPPAAPPHDATEQR